VLVLGLQRIKSNLEIWLAAQHILRTRAGDSNPEFYACLRRTQCF